MDLSSPTESSKPRAADAPPCPQKGVGGADGSSHEVLLPYSVSPPGAAAESGRVCLTRPPAPSGFLDLLTLSSAPSLVALFHATSAHGVVPFRAFLLPCSRTPSPAPIPSCRSGEPADRPTRLRPRPPKRPRTKPSIRNGTGSAPAFRGLLHTRVRHTGASCYTDTEHVALLGFLPSRVLSPIGTARLSPCLPSWALACRARTTGWLALQGLSSSGIGSSLSRPPTLLGFAAF
jgi:hypothetical protein